jgi:hypothetical protein
MHLLFFLLLSNIFTTKSDDDCPLKINNQNQILTFDKLSELNFTQCNTPINLHYLKLKPNKHRTIILDYSFKLNGLLLYSSVKHLDIQFDNFKGFDSNSNPFKDIEFSFLSLDQVIWTIHETNFDFYSNNKLIIDCENNANNKWNNFISNSNIFFLNLNAFFSPKTCPLIFYNSHIKSTSFNYLTSSFVRKNILSFTQLNSNLSIINSTILQADFSLYRLNFDLNLFNQHVFKKTTKLDLNGIIYSIQTDLFKYFTQIKLIRLRSQHVKQLFARNNEWLESLNQVYLIIYQMFHQIQFYDYPNKDFCLFHKFPHLKQVLPFLKPNKLAICSCTELFLIQYSHKYNINDLIRTDFKQNDFTTSYQLFQYYINDIYNDSKNHNNNIEQMIFECNFTNYLTNCNPAITSKTKEYSYFELYDWKELNKLTTLFFTVYLNTIFSFLDLILNIITILIVKSNVIRKEKNRMYDFLLINSFLSILYIILLLIRLFGVCISNDFYCLSENLNESKFNIFYKAIVVLFLGESVKTLYNLGTIAFSLNRYVKIIRNETKIFSKLEKLTYKKYLIFALIFSLFINLYTIFEYNYNLKKSPDLFYNLESLELFFKYSNPSDYFIENLTIFQYYLLTSFFFIRLIFSDLVCLFLSLFIDLALLKFIRKQDRLNKITFISRVKNLNSSKNRITIMIILNGLNYFIFRLPSMFINFYGFIFKFDFIKKKFKPNTAYIVCRGFKVCTSLQEIFYFFYLISILIQFFIFYKFDKNFKKGFVKIKNKLKKKKEQIKLIMLLMKYI